MTTFQRLRVFCLGPAVLASLAACAALTGYGPSTVDKDRAQMFYKDARGYVATYEFNAALGSVRQAETFDPSSQEIKAYRQRLVRVMETFDHRLYRDDQTHVFLEGVSKYVAAEYATALLLLASALGNWPLDDKLQRFIKSVEKETGVPVDPDNMRPTPELAALKLERAAESFSQGRLAEAMILCREVMLLQPNSALAYTRMGSIHFARGEFDRAREFWNQALAINPDDKDLQMFMRKMKEQMKEAPPAP